MAQTKKNKGFLVVGGLVVIAVLLAFLMLNGADNSATETQKASVQSNQSTTNNDQQYPDAPDFTLKNLEGKDVSLSDFKGKIVFLNFWATWCPPCRREIPSFIELVDKYRDDGFTVVGIAVDPREFTNNIDKVKPFAESMGINYPVLYDSKGVSQLYGGIQSIPTTFVINRQGKVVGRIVGSRPKDVFESIIKDLL